MRIRKHTKISPFLFSTSSLSSETSTSVLCHLNQSPWDVTISPPGSSPFQVHGEVSFTRNGGSGDSIGAMQSVAWTDDEDNIGYRKNEPIFCSKTFGEGNWECSIEAKEGHSLCEFHLACCNTSAHPAVSKNLASPIKKGHVHRPKKSKSETNPYETHYYSDFGPHWGKKRGSEKLAEQENAVEVKVAAAAAAATATSSSNSSQICTENFEYFEDDDDDDDVVENIDGNRMNRARKPIKARSLKSLM